MKAYKLVDEVILPTIELFRVDSQVHNNKIEFSDHLSTDLTCFVDKQRIQQILINLIQNSLKFAPDGTVIYVEVNTILKLDGTLFFYIKVTDQGQDYVDDLQQLVQQPQSAHDLTANSMTTSRETHGLGLQIC